MSVKITCSNCSKSLGDRHKKQRYCKSCHAAHMRKTRRRHSDLTPEARFKANARSYANVYLRRGKITKKPCKKCGSNQAQMHHEDYSRPLDVDWLCRKCHSISM